MKIKYILCVLVLMLFIVGCAKQQEVAPQPAAAEKPSTPDVNELKSEQPPPFLSEGEQQNTEIPEDIKKQIESSGAEGVTGKVISETNCPPDSDIERQGDVMSAFNWPYLVTWDPNLINMSSADSGKTAKIEIEGNVFCRKIYAVYDPLWWNGRWMEILESTENINAWSEGAIRVYHNYGTSVQCPNPANVTQKTGTYSVFDWPQIGIWNTNVSSADVGKTVKLVGFGCKKITQFISCGKWGACWVKVQGSPYEGMPDETSGAIYIYTNITQPTCTNDCSPSGAKTCIGSMNLSYTCGNYDADSCLEWGSSPCPSGLVCRVSTGICDCTPTTCAQMGKNCGTWSNGCGWAIGCGVCPTGQTCSNGICTSGGNQTNTTNTTG